MNNRYLDFEKKQQHGYAAEPGKNLGFKMKKDLLIIPDSFAW